jgi:hypothetical protein
MPNAPDTQPEPERQTIYEIRLEGHLDREWAEWFGGLALTPEKGGTTLLSGPVADQAALHGLLKKVRDLGASLISINQVEPGPPDLTGMTSRGSLKKFAVLTLAGCLAFVATTFVFSRLPVAHEYREALSIDDVAGVFVGPFLGGLAIAGMISFLLLRFLKKLPQHTTILTSTLLSVGALFIATPLMLLSVSGIGDGAVHYFMVGVMLNVPRFLALGVAVGYLHGTLHGSGRES